MQLQEIQEDQSVKQKQMQLPRLNKQFIGIGHELQMKRRDRRKIDLQERTLQNRVIYLQKQQQRAQKDLISKRKHLQQLIGVKERQQEQSKQKARQREENMQRLYKLKKQNEYMRMMHKHNISNTIEHIRYRNESDYSRIRKQRIDGQYRKKAKKQQDLEDKKEHWASLNVDKQVGKMKMDKFFKQKNKEHLGEYMLRISKQQKKMNRKLSSMKELQEKQQSLKGKLQKSIMKNSRMAELIEHVSKTMSPNSSRLLETLENSTLPNDERKTINSERKTTRMRSEEEIQQNLQTSNEVDRKNNKQLMKAIKRRKKNKHANRYKEYEAF